MRAFIGTTLNPFTYGKHAKRRFKFKL